MYPELHVQLKDPSALLQKAFTSQLWALVVLVVHSLISKKKEKSSCCLFFNLVFLYLFIYLFILRIYFDTSFSLSFPLRVFFLFSFVAHFIVFTLQGTEHVQQVDVNFRKKTKNINLIYKE